MGYKYCAVAVKTEIGDLCTFLVDYVQIDEIPVRLYEWMGEEIYLVCEIQVDSGIDAVLDDEIITHIQNFIDAEENI